jgi:PAS domain-containing protein
MEYLIEDKIIIFNEKEYNPNFKDNFYYCFDSMNFQKIFNWKIIFNKTRDAFAYFEYQVDSRNKPKDYIFLKANDKYEEITGYKEKDVIGKKITEMDYIKKDSAQELIKKFYRTAVNGSEQNFSLSSKLTGKDYSAFVYCPLKYFFTIIFKENCTDDDVQNRNLNDFKKVTDSLNQVSASQAIIIELGYPLEIKKTRKLKMVSLDIAKYLGILDKKIKLKKPIVVTGLNKIILPSDKELLVKKLVSREVIILSKYEDPRKDTKKIDIYFMIHG